MQVGGGGEHVNKADAMRGAVGACQQAGLAGQECGHRGRDVDMRKVTHLQTKIVDRFHLKHRVIRMN